MARTRKRRNRSITQALKTLTRPAEKRFARVMGNLLRSKIGLAVKSKGSFPTRA